MTKSTFGVVTTGALALALCACSNSTNSTGGTAAPSGGVAAKATIAAPAAADNTAQNTSGGAAGSSAGLTMTDTTSAPSNSLTSREPISNATAITPLEARPVDEGDRRIAHPDEAMKAVPFKMLGINTLPKDANLDVLFVITPRSGETSPNLPAIRMIYTWSASGAVVLYQSPATGQYPPGGEALKVNGHDGQFYKGQMSTEMLEWEQDGVHVQLRGTGPVDRSVLLEAAKGVGPYQEPTKP